MDSLKEMMDLVDKDMELGEETEGIEQIKAEVNKMLRGFKELSTEEKLIMDRIKEALREHGLKFSYDQDDPKHVDLGFGMENKPFRMNIFLQNGKVIYRLVFPFRVQSNAIPFVTMHIAEFNSDKAFSHMNLDMEDGELTMEYSYILEEPDRFDKKEFWIYMMSLIRPSLEVYTKMAHLSMGMVSGKERKLYKIILEKALETINGEYDEDDVSYGVEDINSELIGESSITKKLMDKDNDDEDSKNDDNPFDFFRDRYAFGRRTLPSFEEFKRMMDIAESKNDEDGDGQDKNHSSGTLSMFANPANERDKAEKAVVGGDGDE